MAFSGPVTRALQKKHRQLSSGHLNSLPESADYFEKYNDEIVKPFAGEESGVNRPFFEKLLTSYILSFCPLTRRPAGHPQTFGICVFRWQMPFFPFHSHTLSRSLLISYY